MRDYAKNFKSTTELKQPDYGVNTLQKKPHQYNARKIGLSLILVLLIVLFMMSFNNSSNPETAKIKTSGQHQLSKDQPSKQEITENLQQDQTPPVGVFDKESTEETAKTEAAASSKPNKKATSEGPTPLEFTFYDTLTQKTVTVDATPPPLKQYRYTYMLQVGSYRELSQANATRAKLILAGLKPTVNKVGEWYRIDVGPVYNKRDGDAIKHKVQAAGISGSILRQVDKQEISTTTSTNTN